METVQNGNEQRKEEEPPMNGVGTVQEGAQDGEDKKDSLATTRQQQGLHKDGIMSNKPDTASVLSAAHERPRSIRQITPNGHFNSLSLEGYFPSQHTGRSPSRYPLSMAAAGSTQSSSGSLQALSEHEGADTTIKRKPSTRSNPNRGRSISHSKVASNSQPPPKRPTYNDHAFYPDQSFAQLSNPLLTPRPHPVLRTRSSHPAQNILYNEMSYSKNSATPGRRTADNTPMSSPGLFTPQAIRQAAADSARSHVPQLHHLQTPKETHTAEIEHDTFSGNKFINNYEVISELGRGEHGKVKLGRDMERGSMVAIKIVPRYSTKRRLGKLGAPEDRTKREVAILKKARHANVVSLLEVIDDPSKNKVYLILEYVEKGEIKWRKNGVREILAVNNTRFELERRGAHLSVEPTDRDRHIVRKAKIRHERLEHVQTQNKELSQIPNWSLEYAGDTDEESDLAEMSRTVSRQLTNTSIPSRGNSQDDYVGMNDDILAGSMYGIYAPDAYRNRKFSIATSAISHMSSEIGFEQDDDQHSYVPALTLEEAQRAFRDTLLGLEFLHYIGIIHRDIKPANLLCCANGMVKISDFGVSYLGRPTTDEEAERSGTDDTPLDNEKELARSVGTPAFWAPELCYEDASMFADGKDPKITGALDLWALGITLYCMVYARLPFYYNGEIGLHEAVCTAEVFCPRTRLVPVDTTSSDHVLRSAVPINGKKRLDYDLKFEVVPDSVRDLIKQLLIKDPAQRISIAQAKRHPWVIEGLPNETEWLQGPIENEGKQQIFDINERELSHAVGKRNIIERALTTATRIAGNFLGRKDNRKRASSMATSAGSSSESLYSPALSPASTIGKRDKIREGRRTSLRGDEVLQALKSSRELGEHPLAQSQTASPEVKDSHAQEYFGAVNNALHSTTFVAESERRPRGPDRAISALSNADSIKTIRASQMQRAPFDHLASVEAPNESTLKTRVEGLWEGTARTLNRLASRDRRSGSRTRSKSRTPSEHDGRAEPSLAVSNTYAAGAISVPNILKSSDQPTCVEASSIPRSTIDPPHRTMFHAPISSETEFEQAQIVNQRRHLQEVQQIAQTAIANDSFARAPASSCPPSPDDKTFVEQLILPASEEPRHVVDGGIQTAASASTIASSVEGGCDSSVSNPSHGIASGASSPPEMFLSAEYKDLPLRGPSTDIGPDCMRTADTVTLHGGPATATAKALEQQHEFYDIDDDYGDDADDSDDEGGIVMSAPKRK